MGSLNRLTIASNVAASRTNASLPTPTRSLPTTTSCSRARRSTASPGSTQLTKTLAISATHGNTRADVSIRLRLRDRRLRVRRQRVGAAPVREGVLSRRAGDGKALAHGGLPQDELELAQVDVAS